MHQLLSSQSPASKNLSNICIKTGSMDHVFAGNGKYQRYVLATQPALLKSAN